MSEFGEAIRLGRSISGMSMAWLSAESGISVSQWSRMENGTKTPASRSLVSKMVEALGLPDRRRYILLLAEEDYLLTAKAKWDR